MTWPRSGMLRNGRCYRLETSALRIVGRGCGSSRSLPTPCAAEAVGRCQSKKALAQGWQETLAGMAKNNAWPTPTVQMHKHGAATEWEKANRSGHLHVMVATWPTPSGDDANNATRDSGQFQSLTRSAVSSAGAAPASPGAAIRQTLPKLWPTPAGIGGDDGHGSELSQAARAGRPGKHRVFHTPKAAYSGRTPDAHAAVKAKVEAKHAAGDYAKGCGVPTMDDLQTQVGGKLNPSWVEWLMGYPIGFTACAASGIASSRKSLKPSRGKSGGSK